MMSCFFYKGEFMNWSKENTFQEMKIRGNSIEETPEYKEYRRQWVDNPKNHIVNDFPIHLDIEINPHCNLRCVMCFQSFAPLKSGYMTEELFRKIIDEGTKNGLKSIKLQYRGEPLLHPKVAEFVDYAKKKGVIEVMFNTNANLLNEKMARKLIEAKMDKIICSIDGYTSDVYEKVRIRGNFDKVVENLKRLQELKKEMNVDYPIIRVQMVKFPHLSNDYVKEYVDFWSKIADYVGVEEYNDWESEMKGKLSNEEVVCKEFCCTQPWQRLFVIWDGTIILCCGDHNLEMPLGNVNKNSLKDIWLSLRLQTIRKIHKRGDSHKIPICNKCSGRRTLIRMKNIK